MTKRLLIDLIARYIDNPNDWYNFSKADPDFKYVCNKLLDQDSINYEKVCFHKLAHQNDATYWYWCLKNGVKHGPKTVNSVYSCYYRNGKMYGREWERKHYHRNRMYNGNYLEYECDWKQDVRHGWQIEYWGKGWGLYMVQYVNGKKHGLAVQYTIDEMYANKPIGFEIWVSDKKVFKCDSLWQELKDRKTSGS